MSARPTRFYEVAYEVCEARVALVEAKTAKEAREMVENDRVCPGDTRRDGNTRFNVNDVWLQDQTAPEMLCECESRYCASHNDADGSLRECGQGATFDNGLALCSACRKDFEAGQ